MDALDKGNKDRMAIAFLSKVIAICLFAQMASAEDVECFGVPKDVQNLKVHHESLFVAVWCISFEVPEDRIDKIFDGKLLPRRGDMFFDKSTIERLKNYGGHLSPWIQGNERGLCGVKEAKVLRGGRLFRQTTSTFIVTSATPVNRYPVYMVVTEEP